MKKSMVILPALVLVCALAAWPQTQSQSDSALNNQDIVTMVKAGLPASVVVAKITSSQAKFDTSPSALADLKKAGVPDNVILAMVEGLNKTTDASKSTMSNEMKATDSTPTGKPRLYVTDSQSWLMAGGWGASNGSGGGAMRGGSSPQTVELIKTFGQRCPGVVVTNDRDKASYVALFDRESFKSVLARRDKIALFRRNGDVLYSNSVRSVGNAVKDSCEAIQKDFAKK